MNKTNGINISYRKRQVKPLRCPMCAGEIIYSGGTHDLACVNNRLDNDLTINGRSGAQRVPRAADFDPPRGDSCIFAISFTTSNHSGVLWNIRTEHAETDYNKLADMLREISKRQYSELARNFIDTNHPAPVERTPDEIIAEKYNLEPEDIYAIKHSTETIGGLAQYYGITETVVRSIKKSEGIQGIDNYI